MEVILRKYGNSTVVALPPAVLKDLGLKAGQSMTLDSTPDGRITLAPKRRYSLADLLAHPRDARRVALAEIGAFALVLRQVEQELVALDGQVLPAPRAHRFLVAVEHLPEKDARKRP